ncbi:MBL fold metallo-hydrolase [Bacillus sp. 1P06AnD]|uniref:MBL fold metallo-hydrolase n=1 Tax=Bacillus sp. 1P06AnD TaxID=3132208 RepID=UPI0039A19366
MTEWNNNVAQITLPTTFAVGDVNAFVLKGEALTLVDSGVNTQEAKQAIQSGLAELKLSMDDIEQMIITHHHPDHVGGISFFDEAVPLLGHAYNVPWLGGSKQFAEEYVDFYLKLAKEMGVPEHYLSMFGKLKSNLGYGSNRPLTQSLKEGDSVPGHPGWTVLETPGHAESHIALYKESEGALIGGDLLLSKVSPNPLIEPPMEKGQERPKSQLLLNESLRRIYELPLSIVYAGHGDPIAEPKPLIEKRLQSQHERAMKVYTYLKEQPSTVFEITTKLFPKIYEKQFGLTLSETLGQFDYLLDRNEIAGVQEAAGIRYHVK